MCSLQILLVVKIELADYFPLKYDFHKADMSLTNFTGAGINQEKQVETHLGNLL